MSKTINDSNIYLNKFPASKVRQLFKTMESSKATTKHIKQVVNKPQATQAHSMMHQCTELPPKPKNFREKKENIKSQGKLQTSISRKRNKEKECHKCTEETIIITKLQQVMKNTHMKTDATNVVTPHV